MTNTIYKTETIARAMQTKLTKKTGLMYEVITEPTGFSLRPLAANHFKYLPAPAAETPANETPATETLQEQQQELQSIAEAASEASIPDLTEWATTALEQASEIQAPAEVTIPEPEAPAPKKDTRRVINLVLPIVKEGKGAWKVSLNGTEDWFEQKSLVNWHVDNGQLHFSILAQKLAKRSVKVFSQLAA